MILDLNGIQLNASNYLLAKPFWKQTTKDISMEINYKRYFEVNESLEAIDKYWRTHQTKGTLIHHQQKNKIIYNLEDNLVISAKM